MKLKHPIKSTAFKIVYTNNNGDYCKGIISIDISMLNLIDVAKIISEALPVGFKLISIKYKYCSNN